MASRDYDFTARPAHGSLGWVLAGELAAPVEEFGNAKTAHLQPAFGDLLRLKKSKRLSREDAPLDSRFHELGVKSSGDFPFMRSYRTNLIHPFSPTALRYVSGSIETTPSPAASSKFYLGITNPNPDKASLSPSFSARLQTLSRNHLRLTF